MTCARTGSSTRLVAEPTLSSSATVNVVPGRDRQLAEFFNRLRGRERVLPRQASDPVDAVEFAAPWQPATNSRGREDARNTDELQVA